MNTRLRNEARKKLERCLSLEDADVQLQALAPMPSKATRWGLWDGWTGRPKTTAGLALGSEVATVDGRDYREGYEIGRELSLRDVPA